MSDINFTEVHGRSDLPWSELTDMSIILESMEFLSDTGTFVILVIWCLEFLTYTSTFVNLVIWCLGFLTDTGTFVNLVIYDHWSFSSIQIHLWVSYIINHCMSCISYFPRSNLMQSISNLKPSATFCAPFWMIPRLGRMYNSIYMYWLSTQETFMRTPSKIIIISHIFNLSI